VFCRAGIVGGIGCQTLACALDIMDIFILNENQQFAGMYSRWELKLYLFPLMRLRDKHNICSIVMPHSIAAISDCVLRLLIQPSINAKYVIKKPVKY
jgi:hypothetical protein